MRLGRDGRIRVERDAADGAVILDAELGAEFLADLAANNDRAWFTPRKADFERLLKEPMEALSALAVAFPRHGVPLT
ncbi:MAG TPA: DUF2461 family protein, partial [Pyrinomonadaceae bacterium]|nr:DUF2461 family protein [Pyrinomonadaceae bacterium]